MFCLEGGIEAVVPSYRRERSRMSGDQSRSRESQSWVSSVSMSEMWEIEIGKDRKTTSNGRRDHFQHGNI